MKLSTRSRYGIHAMIDLAQCQGAGPQTVRAIAQRQKVPEPYLEQLLAPLRRAELIRSARGASGGYTLAREASEINVGEIMRALEGEICVTDCVFDPGACERATGCAPRALWERLNRAIERVLDDTSLADLTNNDAEIVRDSSEDAAFEPSRQRV
ncbi:MAG: Rrf2 family transcriptional regulator [Oscillospiraceae bacterium]|nr:Rrf2 family transcriptional regulator [Oscillospiraceae bacterium]